MEERQIDFELAKALKAIGLFELQTGGGGYKLYNLEGQPTSSNALSEKGREMYPRCTYNWVKQWFKEVHNIHIWFKPHKEAPTLWTGGLVLMRPWVDELVFKHIPEDWDIEKALIEHALRIIQIDVGIDPDSALPKKEDYGWHEQRSFEEEPSGWYLEGGEEAYKQALEKWVANRDRLNKFGGI